MKNSREKTFKSKNLGGQLLMTGIFLLSSSMLLGDELFLLESLKELQPEITSSSWEILDIKEDSVQTAGQDQASVVMGQDKLLIKGKLSNSSVSLSFLLLRPLPLKKLGILKEAQLFEMAVKGVSVVTLIFLDEQGQIRLLPFIFEEDREFYTYSWLNANYIPEVRMTSIRLSALIEDFPYWQFLGVDLKGRPGSQDISLELSDFKLIYDINFFRN